MKGSIKADLSAGLSAGLTAGIAVIGLAALSMARTALGQSAQADPGKARSQSVVIVASRPPAPSSALLPGRLIREIDDPNLGDRWLLCRNVDHPGGPGRLVRVPADRAAMGAASSSAPALGSRADRLVIHPGERLVVEENSAVAEARLAAVALESAELGETFKVRLEIGGRVVRVVALGSGRAQLPSGAGVGQ